MGSESLFKMSVYGIIVYKYLGNSLLFVDTLFAHNLF